MIHINSSVAYGILSFTARFIEGFGNGCLNSASSSIIAYNYEDDMSNLIGMVQTFTGIGMFSGPLIGSLFYHIGGFELPFICTGGFLGLLTLCVLCFMDRDRDDEADEINEIENEPINAS